MVTKKAAPRALRQGREMGTNEIIIWVIEMIVCFFLFQVEASGNIGNRSYSSWYETHFLAERKGIFSLIYYSPKHFGRYTLYEAVCFFFSFFQFIFSGGMALLVLFGVLSPDAFFIICIVLMCCGFLSGVAVVILNDIGSHFDEKKKFYLEKGERTLIENGQAAIDELPEGKGGKLIKKVMRCRLEKTNNAYFTIYNLRDSYFAEVNHAKGNAEKTEKINKKYIERFKNIEKQVVVREKAGGVLVFKENL